jgi:hypothetical protein
MAIDEVAGNLIGFAFDQNDIKLSMNEVPISLNIDNTTFIYEMMFLRAFAVDVGIYFALDDSHDQRNLISDKYRDYVIEMMMDSMHKTGHDSLKTMETRFDCYMLAASEIIARAKTPGNIDIMADIIGKIFAEICDSKHSIELCNFGSRIFKTCIGGVMGFMKSIKIKV